MKLIHFRSSQQTKQNKTKQTNKQKKKNKKRKEKGRKRRNSSGAFTTQNELLIILVKFPVFSRILQLKGGEGNGTPLQYSCLEDPMDGGAWQAAVYGIAECQTRLSDFTFTFHFRALEKEMATHASVLVWRIPGTGEPGGLPSMRSHRVGHN